MLLPRNYLEHPTLANRSVFAAQALRGDLLPAVSP